MRPLFAAASKRDRRDILSLYFRAVFPIIRRALITIRL